MSNATEEFLKKCQVDKRGFYVIPSVSLLPENMQDWMKGLRVSIGLGGFAGSTQGTLVSWDDSKLTISVQGKEKKFSYDPTDIQFCVYQFGIKAVFSSSVLPISPEEKVEENPQLPACEVDETVVESVQDETNDIPVVEPVVEAPNAFVSSYRPKHSIIRE